MRHGEGRRLGRGSPGGGSRDQFTQQTDDTPQSSVSPLDHLGSHLRRLRCPKCSSQMIQDERAVQRQAARIGALKAKTSCAPCSHCGAAVCMACGRVLSNARTECCPMARLYVTWVLLCGLPADRAENRGEESERAEARLADMLAALNRMLPRPSGTSQFDRQPPSALVEMFRSSPLFIRMAAMIRQGTTQDLAARHALYEQVFGVIETLQSHPVLAEVVHGELRTYGPESMLFSMTMHPSGARGPGVASRPLLGLLQDLRSSARGSDATRIGQLVAASGAVGSAQRPLSRGGTGSGRSTSSRAGSSRAGPSGTPRPGSSGSSRAGPSRTPRPGPSGTPRPGISANGEDRYHREHCVEALDDDIIMEHFPFLDVHRMLNERTRPGRMKRILRELSVLSSSLPPGIWVKHAAGRPDAIKVIIEGPRDTPYEFGLFEFSMLCTNEFPQKPPEMVWSPRRSCPHKINANLHEDGIVCLSLLGTWHGEAWNPAKSSLLQVLVSVQALIFNEHPYCNEPGSEDMAGSPESDEYNALIHGLCLRHYVQAIHCREMKQTFWRPIVEYIRARDGRDMVRAAERWTAGEGRRVHLRESDRPQVHEFRRWLGRS